MSWRDEYSYEDLRRLGVRGDDLEMALTKLVEETFQNAGAHAVKTIDSEAFLDAVKLLRTMKLASTREALARMGVE